MLWLWFWSKHYNICVILASGARWKKLSLLLHSSPASTEQVLSATVLSYRRALGGPLRSSLLKLLYTHTHAHTHTQSVCKKSNYWPAACKCIPHTAQPPLCGQSLPWMLPVQALLGRDIYIYNFILTCIWICFIFRSILKVRLLGIICQLTSNWEQPREKKKKKETLKPSQGRK